MSRELQTNNQRNKPALWAGRIRACRDSSHNAKKWCKENSIREQTVALITWIPSEFVYDPSGHVADGVCPL